MVLQEVPPNATVVGVPGRIVKRDNVKIPRMDMDQVTLPDPILNDITQLKRENLELKAELALLRKCVLAEDKEQSS